jgi:hypothetical protein
MERENDQSAGVKWVLLIAYTQGERADMNGAFHPYTAEATIKKWFVADSPEATSFVYEHTFTDRDAGAARGSGWVRQEDTKWMKLGEIPAAP